MSQEDLDRIVRELWVQLAPLQHAAAQELASAVATVRASGDLAAWAVVRDRAHRLAGALGSLGQHGPGAEAVALEELTAGVDAPEPALLDAVEQRTRALLEQLAAVDDGGDVATEGDG